MKPRLFVLASLAVPALASAQPGSATTPPTAPATASPAVAATSPDEPRETLGIGYKLGDGIGFFGGDVIVSPIPHIAIDLYGTYYTVKASDGSSGDGYGFAPSLQYHLHDGRRSTPYAAVGFQYVHLTLGSATGSGTGVFANIGYEWRWHNGFGIQLGGGLQYISKIEAMDGPVMLSVGGELAPNLELGIRYMFL